MCAAARRTCIFNIRLTFQATPLQLESAARTRSPKSFGKAQREAHVFYSLPLSFYQMLNNSRPARHMCVRAVIDGRGARAASEKKNTSSNTRSVWPVRPAFQDRRWAKTTDRS